MSSVVTAPDGAPSQPGPATFLVRRGGRGLTPDFLAGLLLAACLVVVAFVASGGIDLAPNTWVQIALIVLGAASAIAVVLVGGAGRARGSATLVLFAALAALTYASIAWSVQPASSWLGANQTLSYLAAFGIAVSLSRLAPTRWRALLGAIAVAATVTCGYALLVKILPDSFDRNEPLGRLLEPFGYWNAVGLMAAIGIPACLWAGGRREPTPVLRALSAPAIAILVAALLLSYSRGALAAAVIGVGAWFVLVPLRLRGALILIVGAAGGGAIAIWALQTHALSADGVGLAARSSAGHTFGIVSIVALLLTTAAGFGAVLAADRFALSPGVRRRTGRVLLALVALLPIGGLAALAASSRGFTGEVSHIWSALTNPNGVVGDQPGRLVNLSNSRPHYWSEALKVGEHHPLAGVGALGFATAQGQYTTGIWSDIHAHVEHAHGYLFQTFADLGLLGVAVNLALLIAWGIAAQRTLGPHPLGRGPVAPRPPPASESSAERIGLLTLLVVVLTFGLHSLIDWTWFIPGTAVTALIAAGWLAGRGPLGEPIGRRPKRRRLSRSPGAALAVASVVVIALIAIWVTAQPLRSADSYNAALNAALDGNAGVALTDARAAAVADPVSIEPLFLLSQIYSGIGNASQARSALVQATTRQPSNPQTWDQLACYDFGRRDFGHAAIGFAHALVLAPGQTGMRTNSTAFCAALPG